MKKKTGYFSVFLLVLILLLSFRFLFFISFIHLEKSNFREQLVKGNSGEIHKLFFSEADLFKNKNGFEWKENNKELVVNGIYHEVIGLVKKNGHYIVLVLNDQIENTLFQKYFALNKPIQENDLSIIKHFLNLTYLNSHFSFELKNPGFEIKQKIKETTFNCNCYSLKITQPPEALFYI